MQGVFFWTQTSFEATRSSWNCPEITQYTKQKTLQKKKKTRTTICKLCIKFVRSNNLDWDLALLRIYVQKLLKDLIQK